jgi:hypothetical protein
VSETWDTAPMIFVVRPACPACGRLDYRRVRTEDNGDGSATRKVICKGCSAKYKIVVELPETGNGELGPAILPT